MRSVLIWIGEIIVQTTINLFLFYILAAAFMITQGAEELDMRHRIFFIAVTAIIAHFIIRIYKSIV